MDSKNQIVSSEWFTKANELVKAMPVEEVAYNFALIDALEDVKKQCMRDKLINSTLNKIELTLPNGQKKVITISRGGETTKIIKNKKIDFNKAIEYAKKNNLHLPMTERIVIEPKVDETKIEQEMWFQEHADLFVVNNEETKTTKSFDRILIKDLKEE